MKIAILAPSPSPFVLGGAENLWSGLQNFINSETSHACEVFKLPTKEGSLLEVLSAYDQFLGFDTSSFDALITGKYPAWMASHSNHRIYMLHTLRGLYDTYHLTGKPTTASWPSELMGTKNRIDAALGQYPGSVDDIRSFIDDIRTFLSNNNSSSMHEFPAAFSREIVHMLDRLGMDPRKIRSYSAISKTVASRSGYFPSGTSVRVAYPPTSLTGLYCQSDDFLFTASRLDGAKRVHLLIEAMKFVDSDIPLLIGGSGPDEERLRELASEDSRIRFLGRLTEAELVYHYANALAVPFVPYDEDYGLITIEAMKSKKPVITTHDAGGVNEFVRDGETGFSVAPEPRAIAAAIQRMAENRVETQRMGENAEKAVATICWKTAAQAVLGVDLGNKIYVQMPALARPKMVVATTFPIFPPRGGGQARIFHLYKSLTKKYDVHLVTLSDVGDSREIPLSGGFHESRIGKSPNHQLKEEKLSLEVDGVPINDIVAQELIAETPKFTEKLRAACENADIVVASHPYFVQSLMEVAPRAELWLEVHNVELSLKKSILPQSTKGKELLEKVRVMESRAWQNATVVTSCTLTDLNEMASLYGQNNAFKLEVPNGFSPDEVDFVPAPMKSAIKHGLSLENKPTALFMGSWHGPNLEAIDFIVRLAPKLPDITFLVAGSGGLKFADEQVPENVIFLGVLDEEEKQIVLAAADVALNPMTSGSGSNLKMLDYMAAGLAVISTPFGARGLEDDITSCIKLRELPEFAVAIFEHFVETSELENEERRKLARSLAYKTYAWPEIAQRAITALEARESIPLETATVA